MTAVMVIFFRDPLLTGRAWFVEDIEGAFYPIHSLKYQMGQARQIFLWNPYIFSGTPYLADPQSAMFYPPNWIFFLVPTGRAIVWFIFFHFILASGGSYLFLRAHHFEPFSSLGGALFFSLSGFALLHMMHLGILGAYALIPWGLYLTRRLIERGSLVSVSLLGLYFALLLFNGSFQLAMMAGLIIALYFGGHLDLKGFFRRDQLRLSGLFILALILGITLASIQLIPTGELYFNTPRGSGLTFQDATAGSLRPADFLMSLIPEYRGNPLKGTYRGHHAFWEICVFIGIFPLLGAFLGPAISPAGEKRRVGIFLLTGFLGVLLSLGGNTPLYMLIHKVPVMGSFRIPARYIVLTITALAYFLTLTLDQFPGAFKRLEKPARRWLGICLAFSVAVFLGLLIFFIRRDVASIRTGFLFFALGGSAGLALLILGFLGKIPALPARITALIILVITPIPASILWNPTVPGDYFATRSRPFHPVAERIPPVRVHYYPPVEMKDTLNLPSTRKVSNLQGYNPLALSHYLEYLVFSELGRPLDREIIRSLTRNGNIFGLENPDGPMIRLLNPSLDYRFHKIDRGYGISARQVPGSLPRFFLADRAEVVPDGEEMLRILSSKDHDPRKVLYLSEDPGFDLSRKPHDKNKENPDTGGIEEIRLLEYSPDRIRLLVNTQRPCWLFLSEVYYPGWKASFDDKSLPVLRANHVFRAVPVPAGSGQLDMVFRPWSLKTGAVITLLGLVFLLWVAVFSYIRQLQSLPR